MIRSRLEQIMGSVRNLFEPVGGEQLLTLLDLIAQLNPEEQRVILTHFQKVIAHILGGDTRLIDELTFLEEDSSAAAPLQSDPLITEISQALVGQVKRRAQHRFSVIDGGKVQ